VRPLRPRNVLTQLIQAELVVCPTPLGLVISLSQSASEGDVRVLIICLLCFDPFHLVRGVAMADSSVQIRQGIGHFARQLLLGEPVRVGATK